MRTTLTLAVLIALALTPGLAPAQTTYPAETYIIGEAEVRSGPGKNYYPTAKLHQGERVVILREHKDQPGWLAIKPPAGSFSWINGKYVKQIDARLGYVEADGGNQAPVMPGSSIVDSQPNVESIKIDRGTIVVIVDRPRSAGGETWLPIQPHPSEVRYIPIEAVRPAGQLVAVNERPNWTLNAAQTPSDPLLAEADQAWRSGDLARARQKYQEAANRTADAATRSFALNRLASLNSTSSQPGYPQQASNNVPLVRPVGAIPTTTTSLSPSAPPPAAGGAVTTSAPQWSSYGILRGTTLQADGQPLYRLESLRGEPLAYVTTPAGKSLRNYIGKTVCVYGPTMYRGDSALRMQYIVASHVAEPQGQ